MSSKVDGVRQASVPDDMEIAPGILVMDWKRLSGGLDRGIPAAWDSATKVLDARLRRRFLEPVDVLIAHEIGRSRGTFGFAVLAIDCLLIETLQRFRTGRLGPKVKSGDLIREFLTIRPAFKDHFAPPDRASKFYKHVRCALLHSGQTDGDLRLRRSGPMVSFPSVGRMDINRTAFHDAVKCDLAAYLDELRSGAVADLRRNFRSTMNAICGVAESPRQGTTT